MRENRTKQTNRQTDKQNTQRQVWGGRGAMCKELGWGGVGCGVVGINQKKKEEEEKRKQKISQLDTKQQWETAQSQKYHNYTLTRPLGRYWWEKGSGYIYSAHRKQRLETLRSTLNSQNPLDKQWGSQSAVKMCSYCRSLQRPARALCVSMKQTPSPSLIPPSASQWNKLPEVATLAATPVLTDKRFSMKAYQSIVKVNAWMLNYMQDKELCLRRTFQTLQ